MKKTKLPTAKELKERLIERYSRWVHIFFNGCTDPTYHDGVNIDLVRNHIFYEKSQVEKILGHNYMAYPDEYFYPDPIKLPQEFMAIDREAPILADYLNLNSRIVPANRFGYTKLSQVMKFDWKEVMS